VARMRRDSRLETRDARKRLKPDKEPYWRTLHRGLMLGYAKGQDGGSWIVRRYADGKYQKCRIGQTDDVADANGLEILDYKQAHKKALQIVDGLAETRPLRRAGYTVDEALDDYLNWYRVHRKGVQQTEATITGHLRPEFGKREIPDLAANQIRSWHQNLAASRSKATANRILTVLKAALNRAWEDGKVESRDPWMRVKPFRGADSAKVRFLTHAECKRLLNACQGDFRDLVRGALLTGCRYGELRALRVEDYNPDAGTAFVRDSKDGKQRHVPLSDEGVQVFDELTAGREHSDPIFRQDGGQAWVQFLQVRRIKAACNVAKIDPPANFHILRHTYASLMVQAGAPLYAVSQALGHADVRMTSKHYAHLAPSHVAEVVRKHLPTFETKRRTVQRIEGRAR
jgi:integrase